MAMPWARPLSLLAAAFAASAADERLGGMKLTGVRYPAGDLAKLEKSSLRGPVGYEGDAWAPPRPGMNILKCGVAGNDGYLNKRLEVEPDTPFEVAGSIYHAIREEGTLTFSLRYGENPNFNHKGISIKRQTFTSMSALPFDWTVPLSISPAMAYNLPGTIQVEFTTGVVKNSTRVTDPDDIFKYYQCQDFVVVNGQDLPSGLSLEDFPVGYTPPTPGAEEVEVEVGVGVGVVAHVPSGSPPKAPVNRVLAIVMGVVVCGILAAILLYCFVCKRKNDEEEEEEEEELQRALEEEPPTPPVQVAPPSSEAVVEIDSEVDQKEEPASEIKEPVVTGSLGRHFHFRYVEPDEEYADEDLAQDA